MQGFDAWASEELSGLHLAHEGRNRRARRLLAGLAQRPAGFVTEVFRSSKDRKATYRFIESRAFEWRDLAEPIYDACARRCEGMPLTIGVVDGSSFAHTDNRGDDGVGPIGSLKSGGRGIKLMSLVLFDPSGVPLGLGAHELWARADGGVTTPHAKRDVDDKESRHWTTLPSQFLRTCARLGVTTKLWLQFDAEGDSNHALTFGCDPRVWLTVRARHDRLLFAHSVADRSDLHLSDALATAPVRARMHVRLRATQKRKERVATLEVSAVDVTARLRSQWIHTRVADVFVTAVMAREIDVPVGEEPVEWRLLTTYPVAHAEDAIVVIRAYALRWGIETFHFIAKSGRHRVEDSQLESFDALAKWITLHLSAAVHAQAILKRSREEPDLPSDQIFERDIIDGALLLFQDHRRDAPQPGSTPTLAQMVHIIASLGGYTGKSSGGPPGIRTFTRGMDDVEAAAIVLKMQRARASPT